jgi:chromosome segregation ATPase
MHDMEELIKTKDKDLQERDLNLSIVQQKAEAGEVLVRSLKTDLALARAQISGMPSSDEMAFLRMGYQKATGELKQKDAVLLSIKANADEYVKEFKEETKQFKTLKEQLEEANEEINRKNEDLKYKNLELVRLKERSVIKESNLQEQIRILTRKLVLAEKGVAGARAPENKSEVLQAQLKSAKGEIVDLQNQLDRLKFLTKSDTVGEKLKQALDKIDEQGRRISYLAEKLQECGQTLR